MIILETKVAQLFMQDILLILNLIPIYTHIRNIYLYQGFYFKYVYIITIIVKLTIFI